MANLENTGTASSEGSQSSSLTTKDILNLSIVTVCILAQFGMHTFYTASKLREIADATKILHSTLSDAQKHTLFRAIEYNAFELSRRAIEAEAREYGEAKERIDRDVAGLQATIDGNNRRLGESREELDNVKREFIKFQTESKKCQQKLAEIDTRLAVLNSSPDIQENAEEIRELEERKKSFIKAKQVADGEMEGYETRMEQVSSQIVELSGIIISDGTRLGRLQEESGNHQHKLSELSEEHAKLMSNKPEKADEFIRDLGTGYNLTHPTH